MTYQRTKAEVLPQGAAPVIAMEGGAVFTAATPLAAGDAMSDSVVMLVKVLISETL
jgi:hypothetical protein